MQQLCAEQIRGARGMLGWTRADLATACGLATSTIRRLEDGKISPRNDTGRVILRAFENAGLEFIPDGIKKSRTEVIILDGTESRQSLYKDIMQTVVTGSCDEVYAVTKSREHLAETFCKNADWLKRLAEFSRIKCLVENNDAFTTGLEQVQFRQIVIPQYLVHHCFVYGNKYVMAQAYEKDRFHFNIIPTPRAAYYFRDQFNSLWQQSKEIV